MNVKFNTSINHKGSIFDIYDVEGVFVPGGREINYYVIHLFNIFEEYGSYIFFIVYFQVIEKKENGEKSYFVNLYGDSSYTYCFVKTSKNLEEMYDEFKNEPIGLMMVPKYKLPIEKEIEFEDGTNSVEEIIKTINYKL